MDIEKIKTEAFTMGSKLQAIKHIKYNTGLRLKDSKELFEKWEYEGMRLPDSYMERNNLFEQMGNVVKASNYDIIVAQRDELLKENALLKEQNRVLKDKLSSLLKACVYWATYVNNTKEWEEANEYINKLKP